MDPEKVLTSALSALPSDAWGTESISAQEVFVAAAASLAAYAHPADFEMKSTDRAIVIPSETFYQQMRSGKALNAGVVLGADVPISFVETRYFVAAVLKVRDFVLVAYRGTADGYDLFLDLNFRKCTIPGRNGLDLKVHSGFAKAFLEGFPHVQEHLKSLEPYERLIGTGHSLGGAVCTLHNAVSNTYSNALTNPLSMFAGVSGLHPIRSCITFGSPKVGNMAFAMFCPWGINVYHPNDPVPMLPISLLGYEKQPVGQTLSDQHRRKKGLRKWLLPIQSKRRLVTFREHLIEGYVRQCGAQAGVVIP